MNADLMQLWPRSRFSIFKWAFLLLLFGYGEGVFAEEGSEIYKRSCAVCHADGVLGMPDAPKLGARNDPKFSADWYRRLFAGREALLNSVLIGKGAMPPKGGDASLSDVQAEAALDYMLLQIESLQQKTVE